ncbi:MAG: ABC transporter ATP-binding protein [Phycisphaerae bacterium]
MSNRRLFFWMFRFLRPAAGHAAIAALSLAAWIGAEILAVRQTADAVNQIRLVRLAGSAAGRSAFEWLRSGDTQVVALRGAVCWLAVYMLALAVLSYCREVSRSKLSMNVAYYMREAVYDRLQRVGQAFHDRVSTGELINRALSDLQYVREFSYAAILVPLDIVLVTGGYFAVLLARSPWVATLALLPLPIWTIYILRFSRRIQPVQKSVMESSDRTVSVLTENLAGVHVVKACATQELEIRKYGRACDDFFAHVMQRVKLYANFTPTIRGIATATHLTLFLAAGIQIARGGMLAGDLLLLGAAMSAILGRLQQIAVVNEQFQSAMVSARRLQEVLESVSTTPEQPAAASLPDGPGEVRFDGVTFGFDTRKPVLRDVSFHVAGGSVVAIVGPTGAGKTTLVSLLARFYDPQRGRVLIDGVDIRDVSLDSLRRQIAYVFQEPYLFSESIEANVAYGRPQIEPTQIEHAAQLAQAHEFVDALPHRYETPLGERGVTLSGGQRQRLTIARAILSNPRILVLDDATASVDSETEELIVAGMRFAMKGRTTFLIAHRISTVKRADVVIVLENGAIAQQGTHDALMATDGHYRDIAAVQLYGDELAANRE